MLLNNALQTDVLLVCGATGGNLLHRRCRGAFLTISLLSETQFEIHVVKILAALTLYFMVQVPCLSWFTEPKLLG